MSAEINDFKRHGLLRIKQIVGKEGLIPISKSSWWAGVKSGKFPQPITGHPLGPKTTVWRADEIFDFINTVSNSDGAT